MPYALLHDVPGGNGLPYAVQDACHDHVHRNRGRLDRVSTTADGQRFERAALRWHARYVAETRDVGIDEAQAVLALLAALRTRQASTAAGALAEVLSSRRLTQASERLMEWAKTARST